MTDVYMPRPIKRRRRTKAEIWVIKSAIYWVCHYDHPVTCRQVFYRLVSQGIIGKSETEYKSTVIRLLGEMRKDGTIPYEQVADNTRWMRKPEAYSSLSDMAAATARFYRRAIWDNQDVYVEVWTEKDALSGVLYDITSEYDVPLMVSRGFASHSFLYEAGKAIEAQDKSTFIYHFGDYDPSGLAIDRQIQDGLEEHAPDAEIIFERIAVTPLQIFEDDLPTRPTKRSDSRSKGFGDESVEVDAIPPDQLRGLCRDCIEGHLDQAALKVTRAAEESERDLLKSWAAAIGDQGVAP